MSHVKAAGSTKNLRDSNPKYLGVKLYDGEKANIGNIIVRQRGTRVLPGKNVRMGKDHTIYAMKNGKVKFSQKRQTRYDNKIVSKRVASVV
ncbi:MAG TPA: 50S ribosomal protein L27 [Candidatus Paceibacterota bacterium]|nr:50S ribosomal protein L27 [Candidatus Paceibacterota bacterium]HRZ34566.1 50S ribosomal protein L27 [Candidatus Paceibacterota bacterium]